jgi:hypothetical protein
MRVHLIIADVRKWLRTPYMVALKAPSSPPPRSSAKAFLADRADCSKAGQLHEHAPLCDRALPRTVSTPTPNRSASFMQDRRADRDPITIGQGTKASCWQSSMMSNLAADRHHILTLSLLGLAWHPGQKAQRAAHSGGSLKPPSARRAAASWLQTASARFCTAIEPSRADLLGSDRIGPDRPEPNPSIYIVGAS